MQSNFSQAFALVKQQFIQAVNTLDSIKLFGNFSILEFFIALLVLGAILPIVIVTIANWSNDFLAADARSESRRHSAINRVQKKIDNGYYRRNS